MLTPNATKRIANANCNILLGGPNGLAAAKAIHAQSRWRARAPIICNNSTAAGIEAALITARGGTIILVNWDGIAQSEAPQLKYIAQTRTGFGLQQNGLPKSRIIALTRQPAEQKRAAVHPWDLNLIQIHEAIANVLTSGMEINEQPETIIEKHSLKKNTPAPDGIHNTWKPIWNNRDVQNPGELAAMLKQMDPSWTREVLLSCRANDPIVHDILGSPWLDTARLNNWFEAAYTIAARDDAPEMVAQIIELAKHADPKFIPGYLEGKKGISSETASKLWTWLALWGIPVDSNLPGWNGLRKERREPRLTLETWIPVKNWAEPKTLKQWFKTDVQMIETADSTWWDITEQVKKGGGESTAPDQVSLRIHTEKEDSEFQVFRINDASCFITWKGKKTIAETLRDYIQWRGLQCTTMPSGEAEMTTGTRWYKALKLAVAAMKPEDIQNIKAILEQLPEEKKVIFLQDTFDTIHAKTRMVSGGTHLENNDAWTNFIQEYYPAAGE